MQLIPGEDDEIERLQAERFIWLSEVEPPAEARKSLISRLRRVLDQKDFWLLVGIAAFPEVRLDLIHRSIPLCIRQNAQINGHVSCELAG